MDQLANYFIDPQRCSRSFVSVDKQHGWHVNGAEREPPYAISISQPLASLWNPGHQAGALPARLCSSDKLSIWAVMLQLAQLSPGFYPWLLPGKKSHPSLPECGLEYFCLVLKGGTKTIRDEEGKNWN